ncbi:hypothetical protein [uncultured Piscinibacter sp.]|uniref:hypothetical protein n=1 Tax=uncultured Piscinibacter sp. TaxID=1131835 RepID=UPI0026112CC0|nr:hypothetical protein [uncultured Piscinibacter sp.]
MDLKLHLIDSFHARGSDGKEYKVCAYERMRHDESIHDGQERWLPTGVTEYRLASGDPIDARDDGSMTVLNSGVMLNTG